MERAPPLATDVLRSRNTERLSHFHRHTRVSVFVFERDRLSAADVRGKMFDSPSETCAINPKYKPET